MSEDNVGNDVVFGFIEDVIIATAGERLAVNIRQGLTGQERRTGADDVIPRHGTVLTGQPELQRSQTAVANDRITFHSFQLTSINIKF